MGWPLPLIEQGLPFQSIPKIGATSPKQEQHSRCWGQGHAALMGSAGNQQSFPSPFCFPCQICLEPKLSSYILAGQTEWAKVGKGFFAAKLQCWGGWESRALLSRRLRSRRQGLGPSWQQGSGSPRFQRFPQKGKPPLVLNALSPAVGPALQSGLKPAASPSAANHSPRHLRHCSAPSSAVG